MSFPLYLLILFLLPYFSTSYPYGIIRNASIEIPFDIPDDLGHQSGVVRHCNQCLCEAFSKSDNVSLFTCTGNESESFICQFYYFMPKRDEIKSPRNNTNIYLIKNKTFEEKDDCCNTTYLMEQINNVGPHETNFIPPSVRFLVKGDNDTIAAAYENQLHKFDRSNLSDVFKSNIQPPSVTTVGYSDKKYYLNAGENIGVYDETLNSLYTITLNRGTLTTIRFLNENQMLVGTQSNGAYIFERNNNTQKFELYSPISRTSTGQVHAFGVVNENAFYVGWDEVGYNLVLYTKDQQNKTWSRSDTITHSAKTSDIVVDGCKRIWAVEANGNQIYIYDQNKTRTGQITVGAIAFNLLIFENYTLVISHGFSTGLSRIRPSSVNCRPPR